ncbi:MAG: hypothetical protein ACKO6N_09545 [Myxococcota bacterium]
MEDFRGEGLDLVGFERVQHLPTTARALHPGEGTLEGLPEDAHELLPAAEKGWILKNRAPCV